MNDPKPVDPNVDPNATPPEGDNPPVEGENTIEHWQKKYGDGENEKGDLMDRIDKLARIMDQYDLAIAQIKVYEARQEIMNVRFSDED